MHILNIIQCANLGGMEQSTLALLTRLQARGHTTELLSLNPLGAMGRLLAEVDRLHSCHVRELSVRHAGSDGADGGRVAHAGERFE